MARAAFPKHWRKSASSFRACLALGEINKRETDVLTLHAADLLPVEMPWKGTPNSPLMLFETPYRQLIPFSPFDSSLGDANMLIMAKSGGGKTFLAQLKLLMMARARPLVSILERGDSYEPLIELMGGRVINVDLDGRETLNPWDLPEGETVPSNEKTAFLKNLTRHMLGESHGSDTSLLDNVLTDAITRVYKRCSIRYSNPIPTFNDLREELANWRDAEKMQRTIDEAHLAAIKLRSWTEGGIYAKLFDRPTTMRLDSDWLFFNVEGLSSDPRLETAMSMLIATAMAARAAGKTGRPSISVLDECWFLLDSPALAPGSCAIVPHRSQAQLQRLGDQSDGRRLCWHGIPTQASWARHFEECQHKDHRPAARGRNALWSTT